MAIQSTWDRNRGMQIRFIPTMDDKGLLNGTPRQMGTYDDDPGRYFHPDGKEATEAEAREAGYDVDSERERGAALSELRDAENKMRATTEELRTKAKAIKSGKTTPAAAKVDSDLRESPNFRMRHIGAGKWNVIDKSDESVYAENLSKDEALKLLHDDINTES